MHTDHPKIKKNADTHILETMALKQWHEMSRNYS